MNGYPLAISSWGEEELAAIQSVIASDMYTMGPRVQEFERNFAEYLGSRYCVMVNSGSSANLLAVAALFFRKEKPLKPGDEVIVPAVSWPTTFYPLAQYGLKLVFVDIDRETLNFDLAALERAISPSTRMIMAVNLLGNPNDFGALKKIVKAHDLLLVEDNCESLGATFEGKQAGTFGVMGTYSTFFSHHMATMEGGVVSTDDEELYHILLSMRSHGWTRHLPKENKLVVKSDDPFEESFRFILPGYNLRPVEMSGAIGTEQLKKLPAFIRQRQVNAQHFKELFADHPYLSIQKELGTSSWFGFSFVLKQGAAVDRKECVRRLTAAGIETRPIVAGNFAKNPVLQYFNYRISGNLVHADWIDRHGFFVGNHQIDVRQGLELTRKVLG